METMKIPVFTTICDALTFVQNSFWNYEWGGNSSESGFAKYLFYNVDESFDPHNYDAELADYLVSVNENPADYDLR